MPYPTCAMETQPREERLLRRKVLSSVSTVREFGRLKLARSGVSLRLRDGVFAMGRRTFWVYREDLARRYLSGDGIEVGALTLPLRVPPGVRVRYVDRASREDLIRLEGPALTRAGVDPRRIHPVDVVEDAAQLGVFADASLDFVVANHVYEHVEDPIEGLRNAVRVLRAGGVLFLTLPDPRHTFDRLRERTSVEHALRDHREGPHASREQHYLEWARDIEGVGEAGLAARVAQFAREDARHHFHVWELEDFLALLREISLPARLVHAQSYLEEFAVVLRKA
jgi:predicted SAM-dependent methyltransferase